MKILQLCHRIPFPAIDGGNIVMMNMALALTEAGHEVHQFALNTKKHFIDTESIPEELRTKLHFRSVLIDTKITINGILKNLFADDSYNISRFYSEEAEMEIANILRENHFDIVQFETLFTTPYISCVRKNSQAKIILRAHNVEHIIWERLAVTEKNILRKKYFGFLAKRLKKYELETLKKTDGLVPITPVDEMLFMEFNYQKPLMTLPMSLDIKEYKFDANEKTELCLFHLGSMDWLPNLEAIKWFLDNCWPRLHVLFPELKLYLAGRSFPESIIDAKHPNVICEGKIEDAHSYMRHKQIMIVPLLSGSGMRVKIIQGMALGKTIISTTIGAEGIPAQNDLNILIADSPEDFIAQVKRCIENPEWCKQIGINGRKFAEDRYSNAAIGLQLGNFYQALTRHV